MRFQPIRFGTRKDGFGIAFLLESSGKRQCRMTFETFHLIIADESYGAASNCRVIPFDCQFVEHGDTVEN